MTDVFGGDHPCACCAQARSMRAADREVMDELYLCLFAYHNEKPGARVNKYRVQKAMDRANKILGPKRYVEAAAE